MERKEAIAILNELSTIAGDASLSRGKEAIRAGRDALSLLERYKELKERGHEVELVIFPDSECAHFGLDGEVFSCCDDPSCMSASGMESCVRCRKVCSETCAFRQQLRR